MQNDILASLNRLTDAALVARVKVLIGSEREAAAEIVAHLAELDTRDVHLREGYTSLFVYCRDVLRLSEWEAYNRIEVARAARRFPVILGMLADNAISLTAVRRLAPHLTPENHRAVLESARGKTKLEVEELVARLAPRPDAPSSIRRVTSPQPEAPSAIRRGTAPQPETPSSMGRMSAPLHDGLAPGLNWTPAEAERDALVPVSIRTAPTAQVTPLSPDRYKLQITISGETLEKLRLARDMLGHAIPSGDDAAVVDRAVTELLAGLAKKRFADTSRPRHSLPAGRAGDPGTDPRLAPAPGRTPSAAVKRTVWVRDLGRCAFVGTTGHRCHERRFVEFHHVDPYALGGEATVDGIQLRCRRHNDYEGRLYFGDRRRRRELVPEQVGWR